MSDLVEWLREQIRTDEEVARAASQEPWSLFDDGENAFVLEGAHVYGYHTEGFVGPEDGAHMVNWQPARVLSEVEAKRKLVDLLVETMEGDYAPWNDDALRLLAAPFKHRPGWRDEWDTA